MWTKSQWWSISVVNTKSPLSLCCIDSLANTEIYSSLRLVHLRTELVNSLFRGLKLKTLLFEKKPKKLHIILCIWFSIIKLSTVLLHFHKQWCRLVQHRAASCGRKIDYFDNFVGSLWISVLVILRGLNDQKQNKKKSVCLWSRDSLVFQGDNKGTVPSAWLVASGGLLQSLFVSP